MRLLFSGQLHDASYGARDRYGYPCRGHVSRQHHVSFTVACDAAKIDLLALRVPDLTYPVTVGALSELAHFFPLKSSMVTPSPLGGRSDPAGSVPCLGTWLGRMAGDPLAWPHDDFSPFGTLCFPMPESLAHVTWRVQTPGGNFPQ